MQELPTLRLVGFVLTWRVSDAGTAYPSLGGVHVANLFTLLCCSITCLFVPSSALWCPLRFPHENDVRFVFASSCLWEGRRLIHLVYVCLSAVVPMICCVSYVASFSGLAFFYWPFSVSNIYLRQRVVICQSYVIWLDSKTCINWVLL
jgi:hypothetical protein